MPRKIFIEICAGVALEACHSHLVSASTFFIGATTAVGGTPVVDADEAVRAAAGVGAGAGAAVAVAAAAPGGGGGGATDGFFTNTFDVAAAVVDDGVVAAVVVAAVGAEIVGLRQKKIAHNFSNQVTDFFLPVVLVVGRSHEVGR